MKRHLVVYTFVSVLAVLFAVSCATTGGPRPIGDVRAEQLKQMLDEKRPVVLVDNRTEYEYKEGHIPGAINIPGHQFNVIGKLLPADKTAHLVFYCRGTG